MSFSEIYDFYLDPTHTPILVFSIISFAIGMFIGRFLSQGNILMVIISIAICAQFIYVIFVLTFEAPFHWGAFLTFPIPFAVGFLVYTVKPVVQFIQRRI